MPPKRKPSAASSTTLAPRKIKIPKSRTAATQATKEAEKARVEMELRLKWFDKYADTDTPSEIPPDGCQAFFADLNISLESTLPIIMGWKMNANRMGFITRDEWMNVMKLANSSNEEEFKKALLNWESQLAVDTSQFKQLYLFSFNYVKSAGQKSMEVETAVALWNILLEAKYPIMKSFIQFIQESKPVKVINKDQWSSLLDFCRTVPESLEHYDSSSSWPVLFDDYVEWRKSL